MVDLDALKKIVEDSGMTMTAIADKSGIARETLYYRLSGKGEFKASEIMSLSEVLHMSDPERNDIFFSKRV